MILETISLGFFGISVAALFYTYVGYPILVYLVGGARSIAVDKKKIQPSVTILITAYNEELSIRAKLENTLKINYPKSKLEILVASDGSADKTDEIVKEFESKGVKLFHQSGRKGKTFTQNKAVEVASGEIIIFSDATTMYRSDVLDQVLPNFGDENIGCVAGKLLYVDETNSDVGKGAKRYWNYETFIKENESRACSLIGVSGCLYAVRKSAYVPMYPEACSDFLICSVVYRQGLRTVYEPNAICTEETNKKTDKEMRMRIRVISQTFTDLWRNVDMMNPFRTGFYAIELISHKIFRYAVPLFLVFTLISSSVLAFYSVFFIGIVILQFLFYAFALLGFVFDKIGISVGIFAIPLYFVLTNSASVIGFYKFLNGERYTTWEPIRDKSKNDMIKDSAA